MRLCKFLIILLFLCWGSIAKAQMPEQPGSSVSSTSSASMPEQWQLTLDVIKSRAKSLLIENNGLELQYQQLMSQYQKVQRSIRDQQNANDQMESFLKERHGKTDQQFRIEQLTESIKENKKKAKVLAEQIQNMSRKQEDLVYKIEQLNKTISSVEQHRQQDTAKASNVQNTNTSQVDDQLIQLRKQLEDENKQEVILGNQLDALKTGGKTQNLNVDAIETENKQLEAHLDVLRLQKLKYGNQFSDVAVSRANGRRYEVLKKRKDQLELDINAYEMRLGQLKESTLMGLSWSMKKKKLVHQLVEADARNNQMREKIKELREDIDVLKDQVARLERRVNFAKGVDLGPK